MELLELLGTLDDMVSTERKDNLRAEYQQTDIRARALEQKVMEATGGMDTEKLQLYYMWGYLKCLKERLQKEGVEI